MGYKLNRSQTTTCRKIQMDFTKSPTTKKGQIQIGSYSDAEKQ